MVGLVRMCSGPVVEVRRREVSLTDHSLYSGGRSVRPRPGSAKAHRTLLIPATASEGESPDARPY